MRTPISANIPSFTQTNTMELDVETFRNLEVNVKTDMANMEREIAKSRILEAALGALKGRPGFDPLAVSVVFGLKW